jgi:hypothetical protein
MEGWRWNEGGGLREDGGGGKGGWRRRKGGGVREVEEGEV